MNSYPLIEYVQGYTGHSGKLVRRHLLAIDAYGTPGIRSAYTTLRMAPESAKEYITANRGAGNKSGFAGWKDVKNVVLPFDIDGFDLDCSLNDCRKLVERACSDKFGLHIDDFKFWFSGAKGFHVFILDKALADLPTGQEGCDKVKKYCFALAKGISTLDPAIYDPIRLWRVPNTINDKSGLYKIPLLAGEIFEMNINAIKAIAKTQRKIPWGVKHAA